MSVSETKINFFLGALRLQNEILELGSVSLSYEMKMAKEHSFYVQIITFGIYFMSQESD